MESRFEKERDSFNFMYLGAHGEANDLFNIADAIKIASSMDDTLKFYFIGDGPQRNALIDYCESIGINRNVVLFKGKVPAREVPSVASDADAFLVSIKHLPNLYRYGISLNKIFEYFACGRPTVIAVDAYNNPVDEESAGVTCKPEPPEALAEAILKVRNCSPDERYRMALNGFTAARTKYSYRALAEKLSNNLMKVVR